MSNLIPFDMNPVSRGSLSVPAHIAAAQAEMAHNITARSSIPQLRFKGKTWSVDMKGEQTILTQSDGETPVAIVKMVIMASNPNRSRAYYEGAFDPDKVAAPTCRSVNGVVPDEDVESPCAKSCAACPNSKKGSRISDNGKPSVACSAFKRIAVAPSNDLNFEPLFLRLPQTSIWDGNNSENEAKGWFAYDQYLKFLAERGCSVTSLVVTAIKFDPREAYPKLLFKAEGWLDETDVAEIRSVIAEKDAEIETIIGVPTDAKAEARPKLAAPVAEAKPVPKVVEAEKEETPAPAAKTVAKPVAKAAPKAAPKVVDEEETAAAPATNALASVLGGWDD